MQMYVSLSEMQKRWKREKFITRIFFPAHQDDFFHSEASHRDILIKRNNTTVYIFFEYSSKMQKEKPI